MKVKDKIRANKQKAISKRELPAVEKLYDARCIECKATYQTSNDLDLDGQGRCPSCKAEREIFYAKIESQAKASPPMERAPSFEQMPGITHNGIKFIPLKAFQ